MLRDDAQHRDELLLRLGQKPHHVDELDEMLEWAEEGVEQTDMAELGSFAAQVNALFGEAAQNQG